MIDTINALIPASARSDRSLPWRHRAAPLLVIAATVTAAITTTAAFALSSADSGGAASLYVPMTPCRLLDTRAGSDQVGDRSTPIGEDETHVQQVTGTNGNCTVPEQATAVAINATAVAATAPSFATFFPAGVPRPLASNLNYLPGQAPTPNKIDVRLGDGGSIGIYNAFGTVDMIVDVTGYYTDGPIRELETSLAGKADAAGVYTKAEVDALLSGVAAEAATGYTDAEIDALLAGKTDTGTGYTDAEIDALLAGKTDTGTSYSTTEIDAMHNLVYTKDEVDGQLALVYSEAEIDTMLDERITLIAGFNSGGNKLVPGYYTSTKQLIGHYRVTFDVSALGIPSSRKYAVLATSRCDAVTVSNTARTVHTVGSDMDELELDFRLTNASNIPSDCAVDVLVRFAAV